MYTKQDPRVRNGNSGLYLSRSGMDTTKARPAVLRSPRDSEYSGCRLRCGKCGTIKLTLAEFREQMSDKPEQVWRCPRCGLIAAFKE